MNPLIPLIPHDPIQDLRLQARIEWQRDQLHLSYFLEGAGCQALLLPPPSASLRENELWKHTCFEFFWSTDDQTPAYWEWNFSPSKKWNCYRLAYSRAPLEPESAITQTEISTHSGPNTYRLEASFRFPPSWPKSGPFGLSAVIEYQNASKTYWALRHTAARPDFHRRDSWLGRLESTT